MAFLLSLISVLVTEMRAAPRLRRGKGSFSPRTWSGWIPVTSTGDQTSRGRNPNLNRPKQARAGLPFTATQENRARANILAAGSCKNAERTFDAAACADAACHPASAAAFGALPNGFHASPARFRRAALSVLNIYRRLE
ncbi:hypothetical protein CN116_24335 [Sinorhizobium meliloti]|nr:hypothetical protein CN125_10285 [Sinorhizobium meliloti]RVM38837.1 hypothetical protein CN121_33345 [Sinorhizobium meliloti]RVM59344.1 hypothetical protein CN123_32250 [Sinorhizobium meliloti]RVM70094.1 hypothetical protein CN124_07720 [Sinorhizobium meliloti]RVM78667.1 hypothetical protein CN117_27860 [Sinorhizobium meliloti]